MIPRKPFQLSLPSTVLVHSTKEIKKRNNGRVAFDYQVGGAH